MEHMERLKQLAEQKEREAQVPQRVRDADECRADAAAIEWAVGIIERLPVMADGVMVTGEQTVYFEDEHGRIMEWYIPSIDAGIPVDVYYSIREAAKSVRTDP